MLVVGAQVGGMSVMFKKSLHPVSIVSGMQDGYALRPAAEQLGRVGIVGGNEVLVGPPVVDDDDAGAGACTAAKMKEVPLSRNCTDF